MSRSIVLLGLILGLGGCADRTLGNGGGGNGGGGGSAGHGGGSAGHGGGSAGGGGAGGGGDSGSCAGRNEIDCNSDPACRADYCTSETTCGGSTFVGCSDAGSGPVACPAKLPAKEPVNPCTCDGLDEASCIAAEASLGCTPSYCSGTCGGSATFITCTGPDQSAPSCPAKCVLPGCRSSADCVDGDCIAPGGQPTSCTSCSAPGCSGDSDCGGGEVCSYSDCCGGYQCTSRCHADSDCGSGLSCDSGGHCGMIACSGGGPCPDGLFCQGGICALRSCKSDSDCDGEYCVDGDCYPTLGQCLGQF